MPRAKIMSRKLSFLVVRSYGNNEWEVHPFETRAEAQRLYDATDLTEVYLCEILQRPGAALAASGGEQSDANNPKDKCAWPTPWGTCEAYRHEHYPSSQHQFVEPQPPALPSRENLMQIIGAEIGKAEMIGQAHDAVPWIADAVLALIEGKR